VSLVFSTSLDWNGGDIVAACDARDHFCQLTIGNETQALAGVMGHLCFKMPVNTGVLLFISGVKTLAANKSSTR
jgi:hypothetical protein